MRIGKNLTWLFSPSLSFVRCKCSNIDGTNFIFCQLPRWGNAAALNQLQLQTHSGVLDTAHKETPCFFSPFFSTVSHPVTTGNCHSLLLLPHLSLVSLSYIDLTKYDDVFGWKFHVFFPSSLSKRISYTWNFASVVRNKKNAKICKQTMSLREREWRTLLNARYQWKLWEWERSVFCITNFHKIRSEKRERDDPLMERTCRHFSAVMIRRQQTNSTELICRCQRNISAMWERWRYVDEVGRVPKKNFLVQKHFDGNSNLLCCVCANHASRRKRSVPN